MNKAAYIKKEEDSGWGLFGLILLFSGLFKLKAIFENWQHYASVNKIVAGIYYFIIYQPIKYIFSPWAFIYKNQITEYKNLNLVLAIVCIILFIVIFIKLLMLLGNLLARIFTMDHLEGGQILFIIYLSPVVGWLIAKAMGWLFVCLIIFEKGVSPRCVKAARTDPLGLA